MTLIPVHVLGGAIAILSGLAALFASKGRPLHRKSGTVFVYAMLVMSVADVHRPGRCGGVFFSRADPASARASPPGSLPADPTRRAADDGLLAVALPEYAALTTCAVHASRRHVRAFLLTSREQGFDISFRRFMMLTIDTKAG